MARLLPRDIADKLPPLYATEGQGMKAIAQVKFFTPDSNWTWYAVEFDGEETFFGLIIGTNESWAISLLQSSSPLGARWGSPLNAICILRPCRLMTL